MSARRKKSFRPRWWPALTIVTLNMLATLWVWLVADASGADKVLVTGTIQVLSLLLLIVWLLFLSRVRWSIRLAGFAGIGLAILVLGLLFRIKEVSGNLVPVLVWRWSENPDLTLPAAPKNSDRMAVGDKALVLATDHDFPQFLGPDRNAKIEDVNLQPDWTQNPPREIWKRKIGAGWSAFSVFGDFAVTQEQRDSEEMIVCYELLTGKILWSHSDKARYATVVGGAGPRATPTVSGNRVFAMGATGILNSLHLNTGTLIWQKNVFGANGTTSPHWGTSWSPLVLDSLVVVSAGGGRGPSLAAYHTLSGELLWTGGADRSGYSSPMFARLAGAEQILIFNDLSVTSHSPSNGEVIWTFPWPPESEAVAQPVLLPDNQVLITSGYGVGSKLLRIVRDGDGLVPKLIWESNRLKAKFTNVVYQSGFLYGLDDGILTCVDASDGKRMWKRGRYGHGQILLVGDLLIVQAESGDVALVEAKPKAHNEHGRFSPLSGKTWNNPVFAAPYLLVRNGQEAACYELAVQN